MPQTPAAIRHSVCVVGFRSDPTEPLGGVFIFRNSVGGEKFGCRAPNPEESGAPAPGYGQVTATYVELSLVEMCMLKIVQDPEATDAALASALHQGHVVVGYAFTFNDPARRPTHCALSPLGIPVVQPGATILVTQSKVGEDGEGRKVTVVDAVTPSL